MPPVNPRDALPVKEGETFLGKYLVERVLGMGGMGVVVAARHLQLDERVAVKFVLHQTGDSVERFIREARATVRLKSEHVARVHDVGTTEGGAPYLVMEFLEGQDLSQLLEDRGRLSVGDVVDFVLQACEAVAEAHASGIVHRDLKPQNLFLAKGLGGHPTVKVLDFGISKASNVVSSQLTQTTSVMGSPMYMSPEQMRSAKKAVPQSDVWALGVVMQELLTGRTPFEADTVTELALKVTTEAPRPVTEDRADVPVELREIIARCLEKDPTRRYAHAAELASALEPLASPASQISAHRARLLLGGAPSTLVSTGPRSFEATVVSDTSRISASTGGGAGTLSPAASLSPPRGASRWPLVVGGLALAAAVAIAIVATRKPDPVAVTPPAPSAPAAPAAPPAATSTPAAKVAVEPVVTPSASASAAAAPLPAAPPAGVKAPLPPKRPAGGPRTGGDDDIPSMR
ncbi:MAG: serine/threonine protein kinase [Polyangiaceae bacterium]|nr:serine/threonine protein kinase [Polyangiaceae bacterium]